MNFDHNGKGAGVYIYESDGIISDLSSFKNIGGHGTGLYLESSNIEVKNSTFTKNSGIVGPGINIIKSFVTIDSTLIDSNSTTYSGVGYGGGINIENTDYSYKVKISNSIISNNSSHNGGVLIIHKHDANYLLV